MFSAVRLDELEVVVGDAINEGDSCSLNGESSSKEIKMNCNEANPGRYVTVRLESSSQSNKFPAVIQLCEVKVFGEGKQQLNNQIHHLLSNYRVPCILSHSKKTKFQDISPHPTPL